MILIEEALKILAAVIIVLGMIQAAWNSIFYLIKRPCASPGLWHPGLGVAIRRFFL